MRLSTAFFAPRKSVVLRRALIPLAALSSLLLAGCATQSDYYSGAQVAMEDDGRPAQIPPLLRAKPVEDDPTEPFSPNYGPPPPNMQDTAEKPEIPDDLPPAFRRQLMNSISIS